MKIYQSTLVFVITSALLHLSRGSVTDFINKINAKGCDDNVESMDVKYDDDTDVNAPSPSQRHHGLINAFPARRLNVVKWPNGVVPYVIDDAFDRIKSPLLRFAKHVIRLAMNEIEAKTCVKFVEYKKSTAPKNHVHIISGHGCWSFIGRKPYSSQRLSIMIGDESETCVRLGIILHELLHALGFSHEQSRTDRDQFLYVHKQNIENGKQKNFVIRRNPLNSMLPYDPVSILHYSKFAFSRNGSPTLEWKNNPSKILGGDELSDLDIRKINAAYCNPPKPRRLSTKPVSSRKTTSTSTPVTTTAATTAIMKPKPTKPSPWKVCKDRKIICPGLLIYVGFCDLYGYQCPKSCRLCW